MGATRARTEVKHSLGIRAGLTSLAFGSSRRLGNLYTSEHRAAGLHDGAVRDGDPASQGFKLSALVVVWPQKD